MVLVNVSPRYDVAACQDISTELFRTSGIPNGDPVNKLVDERFEGAYNITQSSPEKALPHVRWGRINYLDVTAITTRWWVWK